VRRALTLHSQSNAFFCAFFFVFLCVVVSRHWSTMRAALPTDDATTRAHHAAHIAKRDARCTTMRMRAYDAHDVPRDVRERIEREVALEAWRLAYAREKHLWQTTRERKRDLSAACARLGCEVRETSVLCAHFIDGETFAGVKGDARTRALEKWTAEAVARRVAEMRYIHEYCDEYRDTMVDARARVHEASEAHLRRKYGKKKKYYSKRDAAEAWASACEDVLGFKNIGAFARDLVSNWTSFPDRWPWLKDDVDYDAAANDAAANDAADDDDDDDDDYEYESEEYWYTDTDASYYTDSDDDYDYVVYELLSINLRS